MCAAPPDSKKVSQMYFGMDPAPGSEGKLWKCTCGAVCRQNIKLGYANLMLHIKLNQPDYLKVFALAQQSNKEKTQDLSTACSTVSGSSALLTVQSAGGDQHQMTLTYMFNTRSTNVFKRLEWIVMGEHELTFCEKKLTQCNSKLEPILVKTLKKNLFKVVNAVEKRYLLRQVWLFCLHWFLMAGWRPQDI
jgi:hypothetical protein